uniref:Uncharacterized protein n=1 Tax=Escherichia coli TaxID=562 RepID=A0A811AQH6_ECOLX|nr:hypothetical protein [Escherichia coli]
MRTLTLNELDSVSGGASGRDIAMAIGTLSGQFVAGGIGAAAGGVAGGAIYDYASTHKPNPAMSPSGLGEQLSKNPKGYLQKHGTMLREDCVIGVQIILVMFVYK